MQTAIIVAGPTPEVLARIERAKKLKEEAAHFNFLRNQLCRPTGSIGNGRLVPAISTIVEKVKGEKLTAAQLVSGRDQHGRWVSREARQEARRTQESLARRGF